MKTRYIFVAVLLALGVLAVSIFAMVPDQKSVEGTVIDVVRNERGFEPREVHIPVGGTVRFTTVLEKPFWPASDLHPQHTVYAEFDPKHALVLGESWEFVFNREGTWRYHDHLDSVVGGTIIVGDADTCVNGTEQTCWKERIQTALEQEGLAEAYREMADIYDEEPAFASACHSFAHDLGLMAFRKYGKDVPLIVASGQCNDGFYHGYMEGFVAEYGTPAHARWFCGKVERVLGERYPLAYPQCVHGFGHGIAEYLLQEHPELWVNLGELARTAADRCVELSDERDMTFRCGSGIYNVLIDWIRHQGGYGGVFTEEAPFKLCAAVGHEWAREGCVWEFSKRLLWFTKGDALEALHLVERAARTFEDGAYTQLAVRSAAEGVGRYAQAHTNAELAGACGELGEDVRRICMTHIAMGLFNAGEPGREWERPAQFCQDGSLPDEEKVACLEAVAQRIQHSYLSGSDACETLRQSFPELAAKC